METSNNNMVHRLFAEDKEIVLVGTAHVSKDSVELVNSVINEEKPDIVCVELCESRYQAIEKKDSWQNTNIVKVIKEKKTFLLLSNLILASFQKRIAKKFDIIPGQEMIEAINAGKSVGAKIHTADRDIRVTLSRVWNTIGFWGKAKLLVQLILSLGDVGDITENDIEKMKQEDVLETLLAEVGQSLPVLKKILIDERDMYLAEKIKTAPGKKIVAVVGAGHVKGIKAYWNDDIDLASLETIPPKSNISNAFQWIFTSGIIILFIYGFYYGGTKAGTDMITWWILITGVLAGVGAIFAMAHPLTILSSMLAAPLTTLHPLIAVGWVSGLVEAYFSKPKVKDIESLPEDILSVRGFWRNKVTRILLVVAFTNLGASIGTFVALPLMIKML
ncbi:MAG: TraB/GumN family protein [Proteobacteria bacterium]|nr:TraB/GumN family protein [Pseudomonadota bacterium]